MKPTNAASVAGRRAFFRWLAREGAVKVDEMRGIPQLRLSDLPQVPPARLAGLRPAILPGVEIILAEGAVLGRLAGRADAIPLFPRAPVPLAIFNCFNGTDTLLHAAESVCAATGMEPEAAFGAARSLFLQLVALGVCAPANISHDPAGPAANR
jgi:hypothetical protein